MVIVHLTFLKSGSYSSKSENFSSDDKSSSSNDIVIRIKLDRGFWISVSITTTFPICNNQIHYKNMFQNWIFLSDAFYGLAVTLW